MHDFQECPYCLQDLEQWSIRYHRSDLAPAGGWRELTSVRHDEPVEGPYPPRPTAADDAQGLTLLSLCPGAHCGYYVLRYPNGLSHWDRDVEAARLLRTLFNE